MERERGSERERERKIELEKEMELQLPGISVKLFLSQCHGPMEITGMIILIWNII